MPKFDMRHGPGNNCRKSVHQSLGGGAVADLLLWRKPKNSGLVLLGSTSMWFLFERAGYSLLSLFSNALLLLVVIMFFWAKSATLLNRPLPPLPNLEVSDALVEKIADSAVVRINSVLMVARDITFNGDVKLFLKVASVLLQISFIGSIFNFFTLVYIGVLLSLSVPVLYEKYQDQADEKLSVAQKFISVYLKKVDEILSKIPVPQNKEKKSQ
ncbi:Reticulon-like protein b11 [Thalictrum thalictroides]|uniref:Reticulon-like protein n=1 Tax=Thalictrum thalictroides TaxID=46969 RepID=A0A7J6VPH3_THATH|nr:Reticulon-like protein b11 [Thalictrum thalictroides]